MRNYIIIKTIVIKYDKPLKSINIEKGIIFLLHFIVFHSNNVTIYINLNSTLRCFLT